MKERYQIKKSIELLKDNLHTIDRVNEWGRMMGYDSPKLFSRDFRNYYGKRPRVYLLRIKVRKALKLLANSDKSHYEIAKLIGKRDEQALYHFIKKQTGNAPSYYRACNFKSKNQQ
ncbi:helix-turn-helix domain-containing protein [Rhodohalobacter halophilus]|uniref:helix-turn-helix domain-containing protein n=1 Tax=Rhodohalobacter halophilus TaxID=1812810 RepID=UPI00083FDA00|nr:helix-turn-helix domain-containing protein [Rhodohalobacter halophilus]